MLLDDFLVRAFLAGIGIALIAAPLGCFIVWRRMAYFGEATAHSAILGVALALAFNMSVTIGILAVSISTAFLIFLFADKRYSIDSFLGVVSHSTLALGLVCVSFLPNNQIDLNAFLFGDILAVRRTDLAIIWVGVIAVSLVIWWRWQNLLLSTLNTDLAYASDLDPKREELFLTLCLAVVIGIAIQVVGALLIASLLIIPATAARNFVKGPEKMVGATAIIGVFSVIGGINASLLTDAPTGPSIVVLASAIFLVASFFKGTKKPKA